MSVGMPVGFLVGVLEGRSVGKGKLSLSLTGAKGATGATGADVVGCGDAVGYAEIEGASVCT